MGSKNPVRIVDSHEVSYTDRQGEQQTRTFKTTGPNGAMQLHPGGSAFLGMLTLVLGIATSFGEVVQVLSGICARIRVDGEVVLEPTARGDEWFDGEGTSRQGALIFDFIGDESRTALAKIATAAIPALRKREKSARAALAQRTAAA